MRDTIVKIAKGLSVFTYENSGILVCRVSGEKQGFELLSDLLMGLIDKKSVLYLSGGRTPKELYQKTANEEKLAPGACAMIDERFGPKWHEKSNELMMRETGLLRYLQMRDVPFYPVLSDLDMKETVERYDTKIRELLSNYQRQIGLLGIGADGHTAGIPAKETAPKITSHDMFGTTDLVVGYDGGGIYDQRVTMTFTGLAMLDLYLVAVLGADKKKALAMMFENGSESEVPARFYKRKDMAVKTVIVTDQIISP